jgi:hypothetical protein
MKKAAKKICGSPRSTPELTVCLQDATIHLQRPALGAPEAIHKPRDPEVAPEYKIRIIDLIINKCEATHFKEFVDYWVVTQGNPCLLCGVDKSRCDFFKHLAETSAAMDD